ncbi:ATP-binding protein [Kurthia senegalensis]|uniref:ATP-binding protein n=1 Tax=Kurthia senegalensis TaxID=1033740 RepID=UPI0005AA917B|nr:ATP-binding protein [Kurthia senegalensis]
MENSTSLRRRNQFMLFTMTAGMFLFCLLCVIRNLPYPMTASILSFLASAALTAIFLAKRINERSIRILTIIFLNVIGLITIFNTENPYYLTFLILGLFMFSIYMSFIINIIMTIVVTVEIALIVSFHFPTLLEDLAPHQLFWLTLSLLFFFTFSCIQMLYLYNSSKIIEAQHNDMEMKFESREGYLNLFFENAKDSIAVFDKNNRVVAVNPAFTQLYGWTSEESIGKSIPMVPPEAYEMAQKRIQGMLSGQSYDLLQTKDMRKDGTIFDAEVTLSPILDTHGQVIATSVITRDVSYRKEADQLRLQSEKLQTAGEIAAGVAHEVRNPLSVISGFIQVMNEDPHSPYTFYTNLIEKEIDRIQLIVNEFLVLSRPHTEEPKVFKIDTILQDILVFFSHELEIKNIILTTNWLEENICIKGDPNQLKQVLINIIKNAIDAIEAEGNIDITFQKEDDRHIGIHIADDGLGMKQETVNRIFQPFYTTKEKGTGLGMMICEKIITEHKGKIEIDSTYGQGTIFSITLPICTKEEKNKMLKKASENA